MKRFAWRLQRVLDIKRKEEQTRKVELLDITEKLAHARSELLVQKTTLKNIIDGLTEEHPDGRLGKQEFFLKCSVTSDELIKKLESKTNELETKQKEKIVQILTVKRYRKGLEKLRAEAKTQFINEQERLEQKDTDEMTIMGFARKIVQQSKVDNSIS